jgi:2-polyprenyl-3-methyl-5-hydroxy-6-metoxy-1,4-benzoquinol methylase
MSRPDEKKQLSFRDPTGSVFTSEGRVFRSIRKPFGDDVRRLLASRFFTDGVARGCFPATTAAIATPRLFDVQDEEIDCVLEHERIPFPIYPHEWIPGMLHDAGRLTLDLAEASLADGWMLKDATPWNVLYSNGRPVFCDIPSFVQEIPTGIWNAYAQFQRTFILPLHAYSAHAWPPHAIFLERRDGLDPSILNPVTRGWHRWMPFELETIVLPSRLSRVAATRREKIVHQVVTQQASNQERARFMLRSSYRRLGKQLDAVRPSPKETQWTFYDTELTHYSAKDRETKSAFIQQAVTRLNGPRVLDIGANTGEYSLLAAESGATVVAADFDIGALEILYKKVKRTRLAVTPTILNIARPTPAIGWNNSEIPSFLERARGQFQLVMALAVLHHLLVTERVPLPAIIKLLADTRAEYLAIEWVSTEDPRFIQIAATNRELYGELSEAVFQRCLEQHYCHVERVALESETRALYFCRRKPVATDGIGN